MNPLPHDDAKADAFGDDSLADLVEEYANQVQAGAAVNVDELVRRHPEHGEELRQLLGTAAALAGLRPLSARDEALFGDFRLLREIGRGGMGIVYEAEQISLHRRVALKVLALAGTLEPRQLQRFHNEARAAAHLSHSHIVAVYTVGCEQGVHYYAMQLIEGRTIAALIKERALPADAVARLGMQAAEALDYAHQVGVVHRDIKPANLLVDHAGKLWVTDFGLAQFQEAPELTQTGDLVGTLRYMSPEQTLGQRGGVDHRTDIYSLGVTLYELLTRRPAFAERDRQVLLREIANTEPPPPRRLNPAIPIDLETVIQKAMSKEPAARYPTARELAEDLRRFLEGRPVLARRPTPGQRAGRWLRRHPAVLWTTLLILFLLATAAGISAAVVYQAKQRTQDAYDLLSAEQRKTKQAYDETVQHRRQLQRVLNEMSSDVIEEWLLRQPSLTAEQQQFLQRALGYYQELAEQTGNDPEVRAGMAFAHVRIGLIRKLLGQEAEAELAFRRGLDLYRRLDVEAPLPLLQRRHWAGSCNNYANLLKSMGRRTKAESAYREAVELWRKIVREPDAVPRDRAELASSLANLGELQREIGSGPEAEEVVQEALKLRQALIRDRPNEPRCRSDLAAGLYNHGLYLRRAGSLPAAEKALRQALSLWQKLLEEFPDNFLYQEAVPQCQGALVLVLYDGDRFREAEPLCRQSLAAHQQLVHNFPGRWEQRWLLAQRHQDLGFILEGTNRLGEAETSYRQAIALCRELIRHSPANAEWRAGRATVQTNLGTLLITMHRPEEAETTYREAKKDLEQLGQEYPAERRYRAALGTLLHRLGILLDDRGRPGEAESIYRQALSLARPLVAESPDESQYRGILASVLNCLGGLLGKAGRRDEAEPIVRESVAIWEGLCRAFPDNAHFHGEWAAALKNLAKVCYDHGEPDLARQHLEQAIAAEEQALKERPDHSHYRQVLQTDYLLLARVRLKDKCHPEAARVAGRLANLPGGGLQAACDGYWVLRHCVALAAADPKLPEAQRQAKASAYADEARHMLRRAVRSGPESAADHNILARFVITNANRVIRDPALAVELAQQATRQAAHKGGYWNTLGMAHYRAGNWPAARAALEQSMKLNKGGNSGDWFFLAMTAWQEGNKQEARDWFARAVRWMDQHAPRNEELMRFRAEAARLLDSKPSRSS